jgi:FMN phosphatase YigB (HAD superfamily)
MKDPVTVLKTLEPKREYFVGIDSDGCAFDTMEIKQKECFCPCFINHFQMQAASRYARETWEFVNLYSQDRGCNRFHAVLIALDLLRGRREVQARNVKVPLMKGLREWVQRETKLGNPALKAELERNPDPDLVLAYRYSVDVNETVGRMVHDVPPFPLVRECLERLSARADIMVVSQTPTEALAREWKEHGIDNFVRIIAGQEMGTKTEHIAYAAGGKYPADRILMIGDAPGDFEAAQKNNARFFPITPGREETSWRLFHDTSLDRFLSGLYGKEEEETLIGEFNACLPEKPAWKDHA